jgi:ribonuclease III
MKDTPSRFMEETPASLARRLKIPIKNLLLLTCALTHRSYINEHPETVEDNERLEFLGDAVLDFISGAWLYDHFPDKPEGDLTRLRSVLVCTEQLAEFARNFSIGNAMRLGNGEDQAGGRNKDVLLCATFEAIIGALFLDNDISTVQSFFHPMLENVIDGILERESAYDPKSRLQEWTQAHKLGTPQYVLVKASGPDHQKMFEIEVKINDKTCGRGTGSSKQSATRRAAQSALDTIDNADTHEKR